MNQVVILAGGHGNRMKAAIPKPMLRVLDVPMLSWVIRACEGAGLSRICVVTGYKSQYVEMYLNNRYRTALQAEQLGTGHAVMQAESFMREFEDGNTLILNGDAPFIDSETISNALKLHEAEENAVTVVTAELEQPKGYGRILRSENGLAAIVEEKDATDAQRAVKEVNSGVYWFRTKALLELLGGLSQSNAQGEYYLTDTIGLALEKGWKADAFQSENPDVILVASGSEVSTLVAGAALLRNDGLKVRIVSCPSEGLFRSQCPCYQEEVLPAGAKIFGLTAGLPVTLQGLVGCHGKVWGLESFGFSAPYKVLDQKLGFTAENVYKQVKAML